MTGAEGNGVRGAQDYEADTFPLASTFTQTVLPRPPGETRLGLVDRGADELAEAACRLAETAGLHGWTPAAADDVMTTIVTLAEALGALGAEVADHLPAMEARALADVLAATAELRHPAPGPTPPTAAQAQPSPPPIRTPSRRRGLSDGWQQRADLGAQPAHRRRAGAAGQGLAGETQA